MATVTARTLPWYSPPRVAHAWRRVKRYPVVSLSILTFVLVIPAVFAQYVAPYDPLKGSLAKRLRPPAIKWCGILSNIGPPANPRFRTSGSPGHLFFCEPRKRTVPPRFCR